MLQMVIRILIASLGLVLCSCSTLDLKGLFVPTSEGVDKRFEQSMAMNDGLKAATIQAQENYAFFVAADPHINDTHVCLDVFNDKFRNDSDASFAVILGDCVDRRNNLPKYLEALLYTSERHAFNHDIYHVLGNHDIYFNGWVDFKELVGPSVYWFEVAFDGGRDLYISLDTANGSLGSKQTKWFKSFISSCRDNYRHCVILTHTNFFYTDNSQVSSGNMPIEESFALIDFLSKHDVSLVLQGHDHFREDITYGNVRYAVLGAIRDEAESPEYLKINMREDICLEWCLIP